MFLSEVFQYAVMAQGQCASNCEIFMDGQPGCMGSSFTAMGAAFATQGYFAQADLLWQLTNTDLGLWAPLLYVMAAIGGLIGVAMGMPPKMYLWFFMGPAIYSFLLGTTVPQYGSSWCVANVKQDQTVVWKLAEVGLQNSNIVARSKAGGADFYAGEIEIFQEQEPSAPVEVSFVFAWFDSLISSTIQAMTVWTGIYHQRGGNGRDSGIIEAPSQTANITADQYYLMSNLKWSILDRITSARLHNGDVRDAFVTFMSSECGDSLARVINPGNLIAASNSKTGVLPPSVFRGTTISGTGAMSTSDRVCHRSNQTRSYKPVTTALANQMIPIPRSVRRSWWNPDRQVGASPGTPGSSMEGTLPGFYKEQKFKYAPVTPLIPSFSGSAGGWGGFLNNAISGINGAADLFRGSTENADKAIDRYLETEDNISCADLMYYILNGFRWEAGHIYYQLVSTAPKDMTDDNVVFNLFYGWDLRDECNEKLKGEELQNFLTDLILIHLIRNEMAVAPKTVDSRFMQQGVAAGNASNRFIAETGAKAKFGEVYTWALMMPYVQGVLLYLLAMAYPFVCVMIVVPGWHKTLFTWMSFWTWVKLWDLGFAVVLVLERSIWASMGNSSTAAALSQKIAEMQRWGFVDVSPCSRLAPGGCPSVPTIVDGLPTLAASGGKAWEHLLAILDRSMLVGSSIDIDVQNGYYIYIMSALYFAVPAVTGQLVLGAKAGAASMATNLAQGAQSDGGKAASQAFSGGLRNVAAANSASVGQGNLAKAHREQGLALAAISAQNNASMSGLDQQFQQGRSSGLGAIGNINQLNSGNAASNLKNGMGLAQAWTTPGGAAALIGSGVMDEVAKKYDGTASPTIGPNGVNPNSGNPGPSPGPKPTGPSGPTNPSGPSQPTSPQSPNSPQGGPNGGGKKGGTEAIWYGGALANINPEARGAFFSGIGAIGDNAITRGFNNTSAGIQSMQAGANVNAFGAGASQTGFQQDGQRLSQQAAFAAEDAAFAGRRDFANQTSGYLSALGVDSGVVSPGNKPTDMMGMAMSGMLGSQAKSAAGFFGAGGGFSSQASSYGSALNSNYGSAAVAGAYDRSGSMSSEMNNAWGNFSHVKDGMAEYFTREKNEDGTEGKVQGMQGVTNATNFDGGNRGAQGR